MTVEPGISNRVVSLPRDAGGGNREVYSMSKSSRAAGSRPEVRSGLLFQEMDYAQRLGNYIAAGRAQRGLERLGWLIRRLEPRDLGDERPAGEVPVGAETATAERRFPRPRKESTLLSRARPDSLGFRGFFRERG
jgi:hypothetical protein